MDVIELKSSDVCHSLWAYSIIASVFSHCIFSSASEAWNCYGSVLPHSTLLATLLWLGSYKHIRSCIQLLKVLHKCSNTDVLVVLLIYPHSPSDAAYLRELHVCIYISVKPITAVLQFINVCKRFIIKYASTWKLGLTWNIWQPNFSHFKTLHRISFIDKNQLKCTFNTITATLQWYKTKWNLND